MSKGYVPRLLVASFLGIVALSVLAAGMKPGAGTQKSQHLSHSQANLKFVPGRVIVKFKPAIKNAANSPEMHALSSTHNVLSALPAFPHFKNKQIAEKSGIGLSRIFVLTVPEDANIPRLVAQLKRDPALEYATPYHLIPVHSTPNDTRYGEQQHLPQIKAPEAWDLAQGDSAVVVAIIDTGTDWNHPDLAANIWRNPGEIIDGLDNDGNGFVDDIRGWDFVDNTEFVFPGEDGSDPDNDPMDFNGHGTHTAGLAGASTDNNAGVASVSWNIKIMPIRAGWHSTLGLGFVDLVAVAQGFIYAADNGADIANLSAGSDDLIADAARYAFESGVLVTVSAGNGNNELGDPLAIAPFALSVAALDERDFKASYSTYGDWVKVAAPGGDQPAGRPGILSTVFDDDYDSYSGTSMAAPLAAGVAALLKSAHPDWSGLDILYQIVGTTDNIDGMNPDYRGKLGGGRINAFRALTETVSPKPNIVMNGFTFTEAPGGNGNGFLDAGESAQLVVTLQNRFADAQNVALTLHTDDWAVQVTNGLASFGDFPGLSDLDRSIASNAATPFTIAVSPQALPHRVKFTVNLTAAGSYQTSYDFYLALSPSVLLVDDDDGARAEAYFETVLDSLGISAHIQNRLTGGPLTFETMLRYPTLIWQCEASFFETLDSTDRAELTLYLETGGNLFITGQDIGWDLCDPNGFQLSASNGASLTFYENYLHARYFNDNSEFSAVSGVDGDPISDGLSFDIYEPGLPPEAQYPSEIGVFDPAVSIFNYPNHLSGALRYEGLYRLVYFAFGGYEAIVQKPARDLVMRRVMNWLNGFSLSHTPLKDTENLTSSRAVTAQIISELSPLAEVSLYWDTDGALPFNQVTMTHLGNGNYSASIPAQDNETVEYFIFARTEKGFAAPIDKHTYDSRPDRKAPVFQQLTQLPNSISNYGPFTVTVEAYDNLGVDTSRIWLHYRSRAQADSVQMKPADGANRFVAGFSSRFSVGDTIHYFVSAYDIAAARNRGISAEPSFVTGAEDFENGLLAWEVDSSGWGLASNRRVSGKYSVNSNPQRLYSPNTNTSLTLTQPLDLSHMSGAEISFMGQHYFSANQEDFAVLEVSADSGATWTAVSEQFRGAQTQWRERKYSLSAYAGAGFTDVRVRFRIQTDSIGAQPLPGWFVDDIKISEPTVAVRERKQSDATPTAFVLQQSYPNPFAINTGGLSTSTTTAIRFELPASAQVVLEVYDLLGRRIVALLNEKKLAGTHAVTWDGRDHAGRRVASGVYFYRLHATSTDGQKFQAVQKLVVW